MCGRPSSLDGCTVPRMSGVEEALRLWEERERNRAEILAAVDAAEASLDRGEGIEVTEQSMHELAEGVKQRGRARLEAERTARR